MKHTVPALVILLASAIACSAPRSEAPEPTPAHAPVAPAVREATLEPVPWKATAKVHRFGDLYLASQPQASDLNQAQADGVRCVLDFRPEGEDRGYDEGALLAELGVPRTIVGFASAEELTDDVFDRARVALAEMPRPLLVHCGSANRVGAVWIVYRTLDLGVDLEQAVTEAKTIGLRAPALEQRAREYVASRR
ncbi:MAG: hypothetical protein GC161_01480 [Planctomycetaceae bacterium]|nr:hypothetical protein [Planctomycetaceae bacterium]